MHLRELPQCPRMVLGNEIDVFLVSKERGIRIRKSIDPWQRGDACGWWASHTKSSEFTTWVNVRTDWSHTCMMCYRYGLASSNGPQAKYNGLEHHNRLQWRTSIARWWRGRRGASFGDNGLWVENRPMQNVVCGGSLCLSIRRDPLSFPSSLEASSAHRRSYG